MTDFQFLIICALLLGIDVKTGPGKHGVMRYVVAFLLWLIIFLRMALK